MSEVRTRIRDRVADDPGIHFNELVRELDLATGQTQYHLRQLTRADEIVYERLYGKTHYYPTEYDDWERGTLAILRRETCRDVVFYLSERGPSYPDEIADAAGISRSTLEWHLTRLTEQDLVEKRYDGGRVVLHLLEPERTGELLSRVTPTVSDRLVDRFMRLVDLLLEDAGAAKR